MRILFFIASFFIFTAQTLLAQIPTLASVNPTGGYITGGYPVTLAGSFANTPSSTFIYFGNYRATVSSFSSSVIIVTAPAVGSTGLYSVYVITPGGQSNSINFDYYTLTPTPTITPTPIPAATPRVTQPLMQTWYSTPITGPVTLMVPTPAFPWDYAALTLDGPSVSGAGITQFINNIPITYFAITSTQNGPLTTEISTNTYNSGHNQLELSTFSQGPENDAPGIQYMIEMPTWVPVFTPTMLPTQTITPTPYPTPVLYFGGSARNNVIN
jgi:hypothetical protein